MSECVYYSKAKMNMQRLGNKPKVQLLSNAKGCQPEIWLNMEVAGLLFLTRYGNGGTLHLTSNSRNLAGLIILWTILYGVREVSISSTKRTSIGT